MKSIQSMVCSVIMLFAVGITHLNAQKITINASMLDGVDINRENIYSYQIFSSLKYSVDAQISGSISYKNSDLKLGYTLNRKLEPGMNVVNINTTQPVWTYSNNGLKDLLFKYNILPAGTYEYCIQVTPKSNIGELDLGNQVEECVYHLNQELFMINLVDPENNAKIYEHNPAFTWFANYSISSELTYKIRIAEIRKGQNTENAIARNNPIYQENNLRQNTLLYPMSAKPLEAYQPYAWTVDAYYKNILLGGAEPWRFMIIEDSLEELPPKNPSFIEVNIENGTNLSLIAGKLKLKYIEKEKRINQLEIKVYDEHNNIIKGFTKLWDVRTGENRIEYDLSETYFFKHRKSYKVVVTDTDKKEFIIRIKYFNPDFLK